MSKPLRIHPRDLADLLDGIPLTDLKLQLKAPWWVRLFCFEGPYEGIITIRGQKYIQDINVAPKINLDFGARV